MMDFITHGPWHCVIEVSKDSSMMRVSKDSGMIGVGKKLGHGT